MKTSVRISNILVHIYLILTFFIMAFMAVETDGAAIFGRVVSYIERDPLLLHFPVSILVFILFIFVGVLPKGTVRFDTVCLCLILKCVFDLIPLWRGITPVFASYFQFYVCGIAAFVIYFMLINTDFSEKEKRIIKAEFAIFALILSAQIFYTALNSEASFGEITYKVRMVIPFGGSNILAAFIVPILFMLYLSFKKSLFKAILLVVMGLAILATDSLGGICLVGLVTFFFVYKKNGANKLLRRLSLVMMVLLSGFILLFNDGITETLFAGYTTSNSSLLDYVMNGRLQLWTEAYREVFDFSSLMFGIGLYPPKNIGAGMHNLPMDLILRCGIIGAINYAIAFIYYMKRGMYLHKKNNCVFFIMTCIIYFNCLYEICYFNYKCEVFIWLFVGMMMSEYYTYIKRNIEAENISQSTIRRAN